MTKDKRCKICTECGNYCFDDASPEIVFIDENRVVCEDCSIDFEEVDGVLRMRVQNMTELEKLKAENVRQKAEIQTFKKKITPIEIIRAASWLTRNDLDIVRNLWGAQSVIASVWDLFLRIPEHRQANIRPLIDAALEAATMLNNINSAIAEKISKDKGVGDKRYNELVVETIRMLDTLSGKIKRCESCVDALERKKIIKDELVKELAG